MLEVVDPAMQGNGQQQTTAPTLVRCPPKIREAMMVGLPAGFVTREELDLTEEEQIQILGNVCSAVSIHVMLTLAMVYSQEQQILRGQDAQTLASYRRPECRFRHPHSSQDTHTMLKRVEQMCAKQQKPAAEALAIANARRKGDRVHRNRQMYFGKRSGMIEAHQQKAKQKEQDEYQEAQRALQEAVRQQDVMADGQLTTGRTPAAA